MKRCRVGEAGRKGANRERERDVHPSPTDLTQAGAVVVIHKADIEPVLECKSSGSQRRASSFLSSSIVVGPGV